MRSDITDYIVIESATGKIVGSGTGFIVFIESVVEAGIEYIKETYIGIDYYWDGLAQVLKPSQAITQDTNTILADGVEKSTFIGVADGSELFIDGISNGTVGADGIATASFDTVGTYKIKFVLFPYLDVEFVVNGT